MKVIVKGSGLHSSETKAVSRMASELRDSWHAYASVLIMDQQGSMEFDLILVIHDRILVVELENWRDKLTSTTATGTSTESTARRVRTPVSQC